MGDMQEMIHNSSKIAFEQGVKTERERALRLLVEAKLEATNNDVRMALYYMVKKLKGEYVE